MLDVALSPDFAETRRVYLTYSEPHPDGAGLAMARGRLDEGAAQVTGPPALWRQLPKGGGQQPGSIIAFDTSGHLFLTTGERQRFTPAQDPDQALRKILRLTLDGKPAADNPLAAPGPMAAAGGTRALILGLDPASPTGSPSRRMGGCGSMKWARGAATR